MIKKNLNRNFTVLKKTQVADKHVKRCLTLLIISKMQNKTTIRTHSLPTRLARLGHWKLESALRRGVKWNFSFMVFISL